MNKFLKAALVALAFTTPAHAGSKDQLKVFIGMTSCALLEEQRDHEPYSNFYIKMLVKLGNELDIGSDRFEFITELVADKLSTMSNAQLNEYHDTCHDAVLESLT